MKKTELIKLLKFLNNYYQQKFEYPKSTTEDSKMLQETWMMFLGEYDYKLVTTATKKIVTEKEWPPTPGEVMKEIERMQMSEHEKLSGAEAWAELQNAIQKYGRYRQKEMLDSLPNRVEKAAKIVGLEVIYMKNDSYIQNRYIETYENIQQRDHEREMLPGNIQKDIEKVTNNPEVKKLAGEFKLNREGGKDNGPKSAVAKKENH